MGKVIGIVVGALALMLAVGVVKHWPSDADMRAAAEAKRMDCAKALMSKSEAPVVTYSDKAAYDAAVRDKCKGMTINGKEIAP